MKALTVRQPFAYLIAAGIKRIENRTWPTSHRGALAIHAGRSPPDADALDDLGRLGFPIPAGLTYGAIVAVVELLDCVALANLPRDLAGDPFAGGPWCWILADARPVGPIPCKGKLGLWAAPGGIAAKLRESARVNVQLSGRYTGALNKLTAAQQRIAALESENNQLRKLTQGEST